MNNIDYKYITLLSNHIPTLKKKSEATWNMRCPFCGDSKKKKHKARGYIYCRDNKYIFYCHNCHTGKGIGKLLEHIDASLYKQWRLEKYRPTIHETPLQQFKPVVRKLNTDSVIFKKVSTLPPYHPAKQYVMARKIPPECHYKLFYCNKFNQLVNSSFPGKLPDNFDQPRLVLPFLDETKKMFGFQGRAFDDKSIRYITILLDPDMPKIFGLDTFDRQKKHYVVEGPIDSLFLPNALAMAGSDFGSIAKYIDRQIATIVYDNEKRSPEICAKIEQAIKEKYNVCIWPHDLKSKDINKLLLDGYDPLQIIEQNTFNGLAALVKFNNWKRC